MRSATIALVVRFEGGKPSLVETLSDEREILFLENACEEGEEAPLNELHRRRALQSREDDEFGDYVETLLTQPFLRSDIRDHGVQWLRSKLRIEEYQQTEREAATTIASYAFQVYEQDPDMTDFSLSGTASLVRVRVFVLNKGQETSESKAA